MLLLLHATPAGCPPRRLHYGYRGRTGFGDDIELVADWRAKQGERRPQMVWMDVPLQVCPCTVVLHAVGTGIEWIGLGCGASHALPVLLPALLFSNTALEPGTQRATVTPGPAAPCCSTLTHLMESSRRSWRRRGWVKRLAACVDARQ